MWDILYSTKNKNYIKFEQNAAGEAGETNVRRRPNKTPSARRFMLGINGFLGVATGGLAPAAPWRAWLVRQSNNRRIVALFAGERSQPACDRLAAYEPTLAISFCC
jgi:hypothetical protein